MNPRRISSGTSSEPSIAYIDPAVPSLYRLHDNPTHVSLFRPTLDSVDENSGWLSGTSEPPVCQANTPPNPIVGELHGPTVCVNQLVLTRAAQRRWIPSRIATRAATCPADTSIGEPVHCFLHRPTGPLALLRVDTSAGAITSGPWSHLVAPSANAGSPSSTTGPACTTSAYAEPRSVVHRPG